MAWLDALASLIRDYLIAPLIWLCPLKWSVLEPPESCVRYTFGKPRNFVGPGVVWGTICQRLSKAKTRRLWASTDQLRTLTSDGVPMRVDAVMVHSIADLAMYESWAASPGEIVQAELEAAVNESVQSVSLSGLLRGTHGSVPDSIKEDLEAQLEGSSVEIHNVRIQNLEHLDPVVRSAVCLSRTGMQSPAPMVFNVPLSSADAFANSNPNAADA